MTMAPTVTADERRHVRPTLPDAGSGYLILPQENTSGPRAVHFYVVSPNQAFPISPGTVILQVLDPRQTLRQAKARLLEEAGHLISSVPDPVGAIASVLNSLSADSETWRQIIEEPYG